MLLHIMHGHYNWHTLSGTNMNVLPKSTIHECNAWISKLAFTFWLIILLHFSFWNFLLLWYGHVYTYFFSYLHKRKLYCYRFEAKRIVVRQGHPGSSYYFMLSGAGETTLSGIFLLICWRLTIFIVLIIFPISISLSYIWLLYS